MSKAIISSSRNDEKMSLDFEDIEKSLAKKLTDADICAVLRCINAKDTLHILKLAGCVNIIGSGLEPLRGSAVLEQADLSMVGRYEEASITPEPLVSCEVVVPILGSIIDTEGCSLRYIQYPQIWRDDDDQMDELQQFAERYNQLWRNRRPHCSKCSISISNAHEWFSDDYYQRNVCYCCLKASCEDCIIVEGSNYVECCYSCYKDYCPDCNEARVCSQCEAPSCEGCMKKCDTCGSSACRNCFWARFGTCQRCDKTLCESCDTLLYCELDGCWTKQCEDRYDGKDYTISNCEDCGYAYCFDCRIIRFQRDCIMDGCHRCARTIAAKLIEENRNLRREVEEMRKRIEQEL